MKSKELKVYNLPSESQCIVTIDAKPYGFLFGIIALAFYMLIIDVSNIACGIVVVMSLSFLLILPKTTLIEFYSGYMVLYNKACKDDCSLIYYEDIVSWEYKRGSLKDYLYIELSDGTKEKVDAFSKSLFVSNMNRFVTGKKK